MLLNNSYIAENAKIHPSVKVGPFCYIGSNVEIGENCELKSHISIIGNTTIGKNNIFYPFSSIGSEPQDLKFKNEKVFLSSEIIILLEKTLQLILVQMEEVLKQ